MGTLGVRISAPGQEDVVLTPAGLTTPDAGDVAILMAELAGRGVEDLALEASSHGIDQRRLDGVRLAAAAFLNLTQDHLDYHGDMASYQAAKLRLFDTLLPRGAPAVLNADSPAFTAFAAAAVLAGADLITFGVEGRDLRLASRQARPGGQVLSIEHAGRTWRVDLPLAGAFQALNALAAAGLSLAVGDAPEAVFAALEGLTGAPGRLQKVGAAASGAEAYVDYAHTPDGLETVLQALRPHASGRLVVVFGAGGDRDRTKRPLMGEIAGRLRMIMYGAAPASPARLREARERFGPILTQHYGLTEAPSTILNLNEADHQDDTLLASAGKPYPGIAVQLLDPQGRVVAPGEVGEICVRGPLLMSGYWKDPELTQRSFVDGWLRSGDLAYQDPRGYYYIVDRAKDMIVSGGFNVYPKEVEDVIAQHPAVAAVAVIGVPDPLWGEAVKAIVVCRAGEQVQARTLVELVRARKGPVMATKSVH
jgi:UDP-N-acetylmuramoylalanine-D-glutamate ligase